MDKIEEEFLNKLKYQGSQGITFTLTERAFTLAPCKLKEARKVVKSLRQQGYNIIETPVSNKMAASKFGKQTRFVLESGAV